MGAQGGEKIESRDDMRRRGIGPIRPAMVPGIVGDLSGCGMIAQPIKGDGRMDHVSSQALAGFAVVGSNGLALIYAKAGMTP